MKAKIEHYPGEMEWYVYIWDEESEEYCLKGFFFTKVGAKFYLKKLKRYEGKPEITEEYEI